jgi:hypothetical protein
MKTGVNKVPNPKPEKKVRIAVKNATIDMIMISIKLLFQVSGFKFNFTNYYNFLNLCSKKLKN